MVNNPREPLPSRRTVPQATAITSKARADEGNAVANGEMQRRETFARRRRQWETETALHAVMSDPEVQRLRQEIDELGASMAWELSPMLRRFQERYDRAVQDADVDLLSRSCPGKHGRWGRICVLDVRHEAEYPHLATTSEGQPLAWVGTAPEDN